MELREKIARIICEDDGFDWDTISVKRLNTLYLETADKIINELQLDN